MYPYVLPHFGEIYPAALEECYDAVIEFNGKEIELDLNFENKTIDEERLEMLMPILDNLDDFDEINKQYIEQDFEKEEGDTIVTYVEHHLGEMDKESLAKIIDFNSAIDPERQLINALHLVRVGFYPDSQKSFVTFDYSIGRELTNYLLVIVLNENLEPDHMTMES